MEAFASQLRHRKFTHNCTTPADNLRYSYLPRPCEKLTSRTRALQNCIVGLKTLLLQCLAQSLRFCLRFSQGWGVPEFFKVARLQSEFCTKDFFWATDFFTKNAPKFPLKFLSLYSVGQKKSRKIPAKFPTKFPKLPCEKSKKITDELLQERREKNFVLKCQIGVRACLDSAKIWCVVFFLSWRQSIKARCVGL